MAAYLSGTPCPKCAYVRTASDVNPDWQCPRCHIAYVKYRPGQTLQERLIARSRRLASEAAHDWSVASLVAANAIALAIAWHSRMTVRELMLVFWIQSMIIGVMHCIRILSMTSRAQLVAVFFSVYAILHFAYLAVIVGGRHAPLGSPGSYALCGLVFFANHAYSLLHNVRRDAAGQPDTETLWMVPMMRIFPMHLAIFVAAGFLFTGPIAFVLFGAIKIIADVALHTIEHHVYAEAESAPPRQPS